MTAKGTKRSLVGVVEDRTKVDVMGTDQLSEEETDRTGKELDDDTSNDDKGEVSKRGEQGSFLTTTFPMILSAGADYFGLGIVSPLLPYWIENNGEDSVWLGIILTCQYFGVILGSLAFGRLSDRYGRGRALRIILAGDVICFLATGFCNTALLLTICRFITGFFTPLSVSIAWMNDAYAHSPVLLGKNMAIWAMTMSGAFMAGTLVGGIVGESNTGWIVGNSISSFLALIALIYCWGCAPPARADADVKPEGIEDVLKAVEFRALAILNIFVGITFTGSILASSQILVYDLNVTPIELTAFFLVSAVMHAFASLYILPWSMKKTKSPILGMNVTLVVSTISSILLVFDWAIVTYPSVLVLCAFSTLCLPLFMTGANMIAPEYAKKYAKNAKGVIIGAARLFFNCGQMIGPLIAALFYKIDSSLFFPVMISLFVTSHLVFLYFHQKTSEQCYKNVDGEPGGNEIGDRVDYDDKTDIEKSREVVKGILRLSVSV